MSNDTHMDLMQREFSDWTAALAEIERLRMELRSAIERLTADRNAWRAAFQEAERRAGLESVAVDASSAFPLHEAIYAMRKTAAAIADYAELERHKCDPFCCAAYLEKVLDMLGGKYVSVAK